MRGVEIQGAGEAWKETGKYLADPVGKYKDYQDMQ
jgi:hypothetical protein